MTVSVKGLRGRLLQSVGARQTVVPRTARCEPHRCLTCSRQTVRPRPGASTISRRISVSPVIQFTVGQWESRPPAPLPGAGFPRVTDLCPYSTPGNPSRGRKHSLFQIVSQQLRMFLVLLLSHVDLWLLSCSWVCFLNNSTVIVFLQVLP